MIKQINRNKTTLFYLHNIQAARAQEKNKLTVDRNGWFKFMSYKFI